MSRFTLLYHIVTIIIIRPAIFITSQRWYLRSGVLTVLPGVM